VVVTATASEALSLDVVASIDFHTGAFTVVAGIHI
jgi:hypothetical protein